MAEGANELQDRGYREPWCARLFEGRIPHLCGTITADGATYMSMEFLGSTVDAMSVESRAVMSNMAIEAGGKCGLCAADEKTHEFLERYERSDEYASEIVIAADDIEPQIAAPHSVDNVAPVGKYAGMPLDQVCI